MFANLFKRPRAQAAGTQPADRIQPQPYQPDKDVSAIFWKWVADAKPTPVLDVGTRRSDPSRSTQKRGFFPWVPEEDYLMMDVREGLDVNVVADLHAMPAEWSGRFGCVIAEAVFEHLERPWVAAQEVARVLAPGGSFYIATHQCFPIHAHPSDFFRFSKEALRLIFEDAGLIVDACDYSDRCLIVPPEHIVPYGILENWNSEFPAYILVKAFGRKP